MRYMILALVLTGCLASRPIDGQSTTWTVTIGNWESPHCDGKMTVAAERSRLYGTWQCGRFGSRVSGEIRPDGRVFLDMETAPGFLNRVRGTMASDDAITGDILLDDVAVPFAAYRH